MLAVLSCRLDMLQLSLGPSTVPGECASLALTSQSAPLRDAAKLIEPQCIANYAPPDLAPLLMHPSLVSSAAVLGSLHCFVSTLCQECLDLVRVISFA